MNALFKRAALTTSRIISSVRSSLATPERWLLEFFNGGGVSPSGVYVSETTAMNFSAVFACVRLLSNALASCPLILYRRLSDGGKQRAINHPLYNVMHLRPSPLKEITAFRLKQLLQGHLGTWGNAFAYKIINQRSGQIDGLVPLVPNRMRVYRDDKTQKVLYEYQSETGPLLKFTKDFILHIPGFSYDGLTGYSIIRQARESIALGLATEEFGSRYFGSGTNPGAIFEHPQGLSDQAYKRLSKQLNDKAGSLGKSHKALILEEGMKFQKITVPMEDAQFLQTRKFQINEICRWWNVPPHLIGDLERSTNNNIEQQSLEFLIYTMAPWFTLWEQELSLQLLREDEQEEFYFEFLVEGLLRGDINTRYKAYKIGREGGWLSRNDIRRKENDEPITGGDDYLIPLNYAIMVDGKITNLVMKNIKEKPGATQ